MKTENFKILTASEFHDQIENCMSYLDENGVIIVRSFIKKSFIDDIISYLSGLMRNSIPNYAPIEISAPNFYRINFNDERSHIKGHFHQFNFFPWNQDLLSLFENLLNIFRLKNKLNNLDEDAFLLGQSSEFVPKLSFQFYDSGAGYLERHEDPIGEHQLVVPILVMSDKGNDFSTGGLEVEINDTWHCLDDYAEKGDLLLMRGDLPHGVRPVDSEKEFKLYSTGRWMGLFAINKTVSNNKISNSKKIEN